MEDRKMLQSQLFPIIHYFTAGSAATPGCKLLLKLVTSSRVCAEVTLKVSDTPGFTLKTTQKGGKMTSTFNIRFI